MKKQALSRDRTPLVERLERVIREKPIKAREWSMAATGKPDTVRNILRGRTRSPRTDTLQLLADHVGANLEWLTGRSEEYSGTEDFTPPAAVPQGQVTMIGRIGAGDRVTHFGISETQLRPIPAPPDVKRGIAAIVRGASMQPAYREGDVVIATEHLGSYDELIGRDCFVQVKDGPLYLKILKKAAKGQFHLESYNPDTKPILGQTIEWAAPVIWVRRH